MMKSVLFIQGGGPGAHEEDASLVTQLQNTLGGGYNVLFPKLPNESEPNFAHWSEQILLYLKGHRNVILVGHSLGGAVLLNLLCNKVVTRRFAGLYILAAPARDSGSWDFEELQMPENAGEKLRKVSTIRFYHCRDDEIAPPAHLNLHKKYFPDASFQMFAKGGHQFVNQVENIAGDILGNARRIS